MTPIAAILLCCSAGDRDIASAIAAEATRQSVPVELALAIGCAESGLRKSSNPMGVRDCYVSNNNGRFDVPACIVIGVVSLRSRLQGCGGERCALQNYNGSRAKVAYAAKVLKLARFVRQKVKR